MTSPDGGTPAGSAGALSIFAAKTGEEWETEAHDSILGHFEIDSIDDFIVIALRLLADLLGTVPIVGDTLEEVVDNIADAINGAQSTANTAQSTAEGAQTEVANQGVVIGAIQDNLEGLETEVLAPQNAPMWETFSPLEEASFPVILLDNYIKQVMSAGATNIFGQPIGGTSQTEPGGNTNGHRHTITADRYPVLMPTAGVMEVAHIRAKRARKFDCLSFYLSYAPSPCSLKVAVYKMDSSGVCNYEWISSDLTPDLSIGFTDVRVDFPEVDVLGGEYWQVAILQYGAGDVRGIAGIWRFPFPGSHVTFPGKNSFQTGSSLTTPPNTIAKSDQDYATSNWVPYVTLGQNPFPGVLPDLTFRDDFTDGSLSVPWIMSGQPATVSSGVVIVSGTNDGARQGIYGQRLNTTNHRVTIKFGSFSSQSSGMLARSNAAGTIGVLLEVSTSGARIYNRTAVNTWVLKTTFSHTPTNGDSYTLQCVAKVYTAYRNGVSLGSWDDTSTSEGPSGDAYRYTGFRLNRNSFTNSAGVDSFLAQDE